MTEDTPQMSQAARIIAKFGGARRLAALTKKNPSAVYKWDYPVDRGGTGGMVPSSAVKDVKEAAELAGIELTEADWAP